MSKETYNVSWKRNHKVWKNYFFLAHTQFKTNINFRIKN